MKKESVCQLSIGFTVLNITVDCITMRHCTVSSEPRAQLHQIPLLIARTGRFRAVYGFDKCAQSCH